MDYDEMINLVGKNQFEKVIDTLKAGIPKTEIELLNNVSIVEGAYNSYENDLNLGLISNSESTIARGRIARSILNLINSVKKKLPGMSS